MKGVRMRNKGKKSMKCDSYFYLYLWEDDKKVSL